MSALIDKVKTHDKQKGSSSFLKGRNPSQDLEDESINRAASIEADFQPLNRRWQNRGTYSITASGAAALRKVHLAKRLRKENTNASDGVKGKTI